MSPPGTKDSAVNLEDLRAAQRCIGAEIIRTPLVLSDAAAGRAGLPVYLKLENLQRTGALKVRGALSKITSFTPQERQRGVICASSGNHGLGVACASARFGAHCIVMLPENANPHKAPELPVSPACWRIRRKREKRVAVMSGGNVALPQVEALSQAR